MRCPLRLVIIGSSTAAGQGADPPDQGWATRYSCYLKALHPQNELINLAQGGLQTFHLTPTHHRPPLARPRPNSTCNISRALALQPNAVIVQTPSNDAAAYYGPEEQLLNFDLILAYAMEQGVPVWLCAPQPRNFSAERRRIQRTLRQAMQARYGPLLIDAWDALADADDGLLPECDSGDGAHLNNEGHARILSAVLRADIPGTLAEAAQWPDYWTRRVPALAEWAKRQPRGVRSAPLRGQILKAWMRLLRLPNLLIVGLTLSLAHWAILRPALAQSGAEAVLDAFHFAWLVLATVLTAAAGYVFNDYFDRHIDALNRSGRVVVGRLLSPRQVWRVGLGLWLVAQVGAVGLGISVGNLWLTGLFVGTSWLLAFYAWRLKCTVVVGNALVALLCSLVPLLPWLAEAPALETLDVSNGGRTVRATLGLYALFAFMVNLWRELVKDLEDASGDAACCCQTLPVRLGLPVAQKVAVGFGLVFSALIGGVLGWQAEGKASGGAVALGVALLGVPSAVLVGLLCSASQRQHFAWVSLGIKLLMLAGLLWLLWAS